MERLLTADKAKRKNAKRKNIFNARAEFLIFAMQMCKEVTTCNIGRQPVTLINIMDFV